MVIVFDTLFAGLDSVEVIALQMNPLSVMAPDAFTNLYKLKTGRVMYQYQIEHWKSSRAIIDYVRHF